jgi:hypothetical protein
MSGSLATAADEPATQVERRAMIWRIEVFVEGKHLEYVLWALAGKAVEVRTPQPVVNATAKANGMHAKTRGDTLALLGTWLKETKLKRLRAKDIKGFCEKHGLSVKSYNHVIDKAIAAGLLNKVRGTTTSNAAYTVGKI